MSKCTVLNVGAIAVWCPHSESSKDSHCRKSCISKCRRFCFIQSLAFHLPFMLQELSAAEIIISRNRLFYVHIVSVFRKRPEVTNIKNYSKNGKNNLILQQFYLFCLPFDIPQLSITYLKSLQISDFSPQLENSYRWNSSLLCHSFAKINLPLYCINGVRHRKYSFYIWYQSNKVNIWQDQRLSVFLPLSPLLLKKKKKCFELVNRWQNTKICLNSHCFKVCYHCICNSSK